MKKFLPPAGLPSQDSVTFNAMKPADLKASKFYRLEFRTQLLWIVLVAVVLAVGIFAAASMVLQRRLAMQEFDNATLATIESAELGLVIGLKEENFESIYTVVSWVKENPNVSFIVLTDSSQTSVAAFPEDFSLTADEIENLPRKLSLDDTVYVRKGEWAASFAGDGKLYIGFSTRYLKALEAEAFKNLFFILTLVVIGCVGFSYRIARGLVLPLESLKRVTDKVAKNATHERADPEEGSREVRAVASAFNNMLDQLLQSQRERMEQMHQFNTELADRNDLIETINQQIIDSIEYSKSIQRSLFPQTELLKTPLYEAFTLFRPRDIVSGDFYWATEWNGLVYWAVVDCTGHGVPGAFMTLVGATYLEQAVKRIGGTDPAAIMEVMNASIRQFLKQESDAPLSQDGMDMALVIIDTKSGNLHFSGARNPLVAIKADGTFIELKGDKRSIAGKKRYAVENPFTHHVLALEKNLNIYLFTDGYADQHNAEDKKIGSRRLKEHLQSIAQLPMLDQLKVLELTYDKHRGEESQIDDVTLLGMRFNFSDSIFPV